MQMAESVERLAQYLSSGKCFVLTGAGISTESGIPDYRGVDRVDPAPKPMTYQEFTGSSLARQRYWARATIGWQRMAAVAPNAGHLAVAELERLELITGVVTQNVDGLHRAAGTERLVELHGDISLVLCMSCGRREVRGHMQERLQAANPGFDPGDVEERPDFDAEIAHDAYATFVVPTCAACGGVLKPDVVFFGENVPPQRVAIANEWLDAAERVLVLGSSLEVFSGYRFLRSAASAGKDVAIINRGPTRADELASLRLDVRIGEVLPAALAVLGG